MEKEILEKYIKAGKIAAEVLEYGNSIVKEGVSVLELAEKIESKIFSLGAKPAFPVNISINEIAAHFTPTIQDKTLIKASDYVKIDVGVHVDGFIADNAHTAKVEGKDRLIECSEKMLETGLVLFTPGRKLAEIGEAIENVAKEFGFNPIRNLTGHGLDRFNLHAGSTIPNIKINSDKILKEGEVYAVEPFATIGAGMVKDSEPVLIYLWLQDKPIRSIEARKILDLAKNRFDRLPFAKRWLQKEFSSLKLDIALKQLLAVNALHPYNILKEVSGKPVSQSEHTVIVAEKPIIITKL